MSNPSFLLPDDLAFDENGHASDVALSALADGQLEILGANLHTHVEGCGACTARLGQSALLSAHVGDALFAWGRERPQTPTAAALASRDEVLALNALNALPRAIPPSPVRRPLPFLAIAAALVVAILCAGPSFADPTGEPRWHAWIRAPLSFAGHLAWKAALHALHPSHTTVLLQWASSVVFTVLAIVIAARLGRGRSFQGEV
jgi:hypothetical protein